MAVSHGEAELSLGSFDEPRLVSPEYELWTIRREPGLPRCRCLNMQLTASREPRAQTGR